MKFLLSLILSVSSLFIGLDAYAQREARTFNAAKPLPTINFMSEDQFQARTKLVRNKSPNDAFLAYELRIPNDWREVQQQSGELNLSLKLFNSLAVYESPASQIEQPSRVQVQAIKLDTAVTPERWLLEHMLSLGYHLEFMGIYGDTRAESVIAYIDKGQNYIERAVVEINGRRALLVTYSMPVEKWQAEQVMQAQVIDSFEVLNEFSGDVENFKYYDFLDVATIRYPKEWSLRPRDILDADRMTANVLNVPNLAEDLRQVNEINGRIEVELVSHFGTQNLAAEVARQKEEFEKHKFEYTPQFEVDMNSQFFIPPAFDFADINAWESPQTFGNKNVQTELWFATLGAGDYYYFVKMLTPSRKTDYYTWLRNSEVYKIVLEGIRPNLNTQIFKPPRQASKAEE